MNYAVWREPADIEKNVVESFVLERLRGEIRLAVIASIVMLGGFVLSFPIMGIEWDIILIGCFYLLISLALWGYIIYLLVVRSAIKKGDYWVCESTVERKYSGYTRGITYYRVYSDLEEVGKISTTRRTFELIENGDSVLVVKVDKISARYDVVPF